MEREAMVKQTEYDAIAEQVAAGLKKYLPDLRKPGGLAALTLCASAPAGGNLFKSRMGPWATVQVTVNIVADTDQP